MSNTKQEISYLNTIKIQRKKRSINKTDFTSFIFLSIGFAIVIISLITLIVFMYFSYNKTQFIGGLSTLIAALFACIVQLTIFFKGKVEVNVQKTKETYRTFEKLCIKYKPSNDVIVDLLNKINMRLFSKIGFSIAYNANKDMQLDIKYTSSSISSLEKSNYEYFKDQYISLIENYFENKQSEQVETFFSETYSLINVINEIIHKYFANQYDKTIFDKLLKRKIFELCSYLIPFIEFWLGDVDTLADFVYYVYNVKKEGNQ